MAIDKYVRGLREVLKYLDWKKVEEIGLVLQEARVRGSTVFVFGNGGSATTASHIAGDLSKNTQREGVPSIKSVALNESAYLMTAYANDAKYENVFSSQLEREISAGDVVIAVTGSGNSTNIVMALVYAKKCKAITIALTGFHGGLVKEVADISLVVPCFVMEQIEDVHLIVGHMLTTLLKEDVLS